MNLPEILIELYCEELPALQAEILSRDWTTQCHKAFTDLGINIVHAKTFVTPHRLTIYFQELSVNLEDRFKYGPSRKAAYNADQSWSNAALSWARSLNISLTEAVWRQKNRSECLAVLTPFDIDGFKKNLLAFIESTIKAVPLKKSMHWSLTDKSLSFIRPIRNVLGLWGKEILKGRLFELSSVNFTYIDGPFCEKKLIIEDPRHYESQLFEKNIIADPVKRRSIILAQMTEIEKKVNGQVQCLENLLNETVHLTERPKVILGSFSPKYLILPPELIEYALNMHQKAFSIYENNSHQLMPRFLVVGQAGHETSDVCAGYEFVVESRFEDAMFFYRNDLKASFRVWEKMLSKLSIHEKLGSYQDKSNRLQRLYRHFFAYHDNDLNNSLRAIRLCKCDLASEVVTEIPELCGIMGAHYAKMAKEPETVVSIIKEHYFPKNLGDSLPQNLSARRVALIDKIDVVVGLIGIGESPRANADPFAIRRHTLGALKILMDGELDDDLDLSELVQASVASYGADQLSENVLEEVLEFFRQRFKFLLQKEGLDSKIVHAFLVQGDLRIAHLFEQIKSFSEFKSHYPEKNFCITEKRARQLLNSHHIVSDFSASDLGQGCVQLDLVVLKNKLRAAAASTTAVALLDEIVKLTPQVFLELSCYNNYWLELWLLSKKMNAFLEENFILDAEPELKTLYLDLIFKALMLFNRYLNCALL